VLSTLPPELGVDKARRRWRRGGGIAAVLFAAVVVVAAFNLLGVKTSTATSRLSDGTTVEVRYGLITRPGLATPWTVTVHRPGGFDAPITIRTDSSYLAMFDENGLDPDPASATSDRDDVIWEFDPPPGDTLVVTFDARIEPGVQWGEDGRTVVDLGDVQGEVAYHTWVLP
jgi:hypothetical protein